jgi:hypothetical protein
MNLRRIGATLSSTLIIGASYIGPAFANSYKRDDGDEPGAGLSIASAVIWFVLLPVAISAVIALFVLAPGWTKGAKQSANNQYLDDPTNRQLGN